MSDFAPQLVAYLATPSSDCSAPTSCPVSTPATMLTVCPNQDSVWRGLCVEVSPKFLEIERIHIDSFGCFGDEMTNASIRVISSAFCESTPFRSPEQSTRCQLSSPHPRRRFLRHLAQAVPWTTAASLGLTFSPVLLPFSRVRNQFRICLISIAGMVQSFRPFCINMRGPKRRCESPLRRKSCVSFLRNRFTENSRATRC